MRMYTCLKASGKMTLLLKLSLIKKNTSFCLVNRLWIIERGIFVRSALVSAYGVKNEVYACVMR